MHTSALIASGLHDLAERFVAAFKRRRPSPACLAVLGAADADGRLPADANERWPAAFSEACRLRLVDMDQAWGGPYVLTARGVEITARNQAEL